jgi:cobalt/nickel transport protein
MKQFALGSGLVILLVAGLLSYLADPDPDGLDAVAERGCASTDGELVGTCIAQDAAEHPFAGTPLADYTIGGDGRLTGIAGVLGSVVVLLLALGLFRLLRFRRGQRVHDR